MVNPASPPKAQRTLIDAEVAGKLSEEEWPILSPENVTPEQTRSAPMQAVPGASYNRSSGSGAPGLLSRRQDNRLSTGSNWTPPEEWDTCLSQEVNSQQQITTTRPELRSARNRLSTGNRLSAAPTWTSPEEWNTRLSQDVNSQQQVHAITTANDEAIDSPLARKQSGRGTQSSSPGTTFQRRSLPLSAQGQPASATPTAASRHGEAMSTSANEQLLDTNASAYAFSSHFSSSGSAATPLLSEYQYGVQGANTVEDKETQVQAHGVIEPTDNYPPRRSRENSFDSSDTWSQAAGSSIDEERHQQFESSTRVRFPHPHLHGGGPVLRIHEDADEVLMGNAGDVPEVPPIPEVIPDEAAQVSTLAGRFSRETLSRMSSRISLRMGLRSGTSQSPEVDTNCTPTPVKANPVRSIRPPGNTSAGVDPQGTSGPTVQQSQESLKATKPPLERGSAGKRNAREAPKPSVTARGIIANDERAPDIELTTSIHGVSKVIPVTLLASVDIVTNT